MAVKQFNILCIRLNFLEFNSKPRYVSISICTSKFETIKQKVDKVSCLNFPCFDFDQIIQ